MTVVHKEVEGGEGEEGEGKEESTIQRKRLRVEVREGRKVRWWAGVIWTY